MKKLIVLTALAALMASTVGCECCGLFRRGGWFRGCQPEAMCVDPCAPCAAPCPPLGVTGGCATGACGPVTTPVITPGPETYVPAPTQ